MSKPETIASLRRKVERLEAQKAELEARLDLHLTAYRENLYGAIDAKIRIKQAMAILSGEDEA